MYEGVSYGSDAIRSSIAVLLVVIACLLLACPQVQVDGFYPMTISVTVTNTELATLTLTMAAMDR
eukprot:m.130955 g.130955  ORF g.130955 m.130955 type:complete len:65 (-) comp52359_c0_seq37:97-291(-)